MDNYMKNLFFVRHGESVANQTRIIAGHADIDLTDLGIKEAIKAGVELKQLNQKIDLIISSPLKRALRTAQEIAKQINYPEADIIVHQSAIERFRGKLEGQPVSNQEGMLDRDFIIQGAESEADMLSRAKDLFEYLNNCKEDNILVVSHNQFGRSFVSYLTNIDRDDVQKLPNAHVFNIKISSWNTSTNPHTDDLNIISI